MWMNAYWICSPVKFSYSGNFIYIYVYSFHKQHHGEGRGKITDIKFQNQI